MRSAVLAAVAAIAVFLLVSCDSEERNPHVPPPSAEPAEGTPMSTLRPGSPSPESPPSIPNKYEENAYALSEGKRLFQSFNCVGCHAHGGGGMGPALMDNKWIYGERPEQIYATIVEGRPNGMPSFRGRIPEYQVWQLVAYVRSVGGLTSRTPAPGRNDDMQGAPPECTAPKQKPNDSSVPKSAEMPQ